MNEVVLDPCEVDEISLNLNLSREEGKDYRFKLGYSECFLVVEWNNFQQFKFLLKG